MSRDSMQKSHKMKILKRLPPQPRRQNQINIFQELVIKKMTENEKKRRNIHGEAIQKLEC